MSGYPHTRGVGVVIPLPRVLQVSTCFYTSYIYFNDIPEVERANLGLFRAISDLPHWGVKIEKIVISPERGTQLFRPLGHLFQWLFAWDLDSSRTAGSHVSASGDVDTLGRISLIVIQSGK